MKSLKSSCLAAAVGLFIVGCRTEDPIVDDGIEELSKGGEAIIANLNSIILPVVDFEDASVEEAIDFLRLRSVELDPSREPTQKGISFIVRRSRLSEKPLKDVSSLNPYSVSLDHSVTYTAENVRFLDALAEVARQGELDLYLTSVGIIVVPEGESPFPNPKATEGEVWKVLRKSE